MIMKMMIDDDDDNDDDNMIIDNDGDPNTEARISLLTLPASLSLVQPLIRHF